MSHKYKIVVPKFTVKESSLLVKVNNINNAKSVYSLMKDNEMVNSPKESFWVICLDGRHNLICIEEVSVGNLSTSLVHPREVFRTAIQFSAAAIIVCHNHPSGNIAPSKEDIEVTNRLYKTGKIIGIPLLDHIIVGQPIDGSTHYFSFREEGHVFDVA